MSDRSYEEGLKVRREVLGEAHVERASADATAIDRDFQRWITESVWGREDSVDHGPDGRVVCHSSRSSSRWDSGMIGRAS